jgi:spermidine synthase
VIRLFFFASGLSALVYQVVWTRAAGLALGNTPAAVGTVVAVFMAGLAIGSAWAGRSAHRFRALRLYGILEIAIGLFGLAVPWLFRAASHVQAAAYGTPLFAPAGLLCSALILLPATVLMGATFPLLVQHAGRAEAAGGLYAANSLGAALGALGAGLLLVPRIGYAATTGIAVALNVAIGLAAVRRGGSAAAPSEVPAAPPLSRAEKSAVAVYALSGFAALAAEMAWTRALVLSLGSTVYAFSLILAGFILGLALGAALAARRIARLRDPLRAAALLQVLIAAWGALLVWLLADLPIRMGDVIVVFKERFLLLQLAEAAVVLGLVLPPAALMGAVLPVAMAVFPADRAARTAGRLYAANSLASIAGTLGASFLLLPALGLDWTLRAVCGVNLAAALVAAGRRPGRLGLAAGAVALALFLVPRWDLSLAASGTYLVAPMLGDEDSELELARRHPIEAAYWDAFGLVSVHRVPGGRALRVNGKTDASSNAGDMPAQVLIAQIPMLLHPDPRDVLVIGLASGVTLASAQAHGPRSADCVEISPAMVLATSHFADTNRGALSRPGTRILVQDGRTHVRYADRRYDVIVSEPSNLWVSGMANLFTRDFFREVRARLAPGGVFAQWIHIYKLSPDDVRGLLRTFREEFTGAHLFEMNPLGDYLMVALPGPSRPRWADLEARAGRLEVAGMLRSAGIADATALAATHVMGPEEMLRAGAAGRVLTDDDCWIEYTAPRSMLSRDLSGSYRIFEEHGRSAACLFDPAGLDAARLERFAVSRRELRSALLDSGGRDPGRCRERFDALLLANPDDALARLHAEREGRSAYRRGVRARDEGRVEDAVRELSGVPSVSSRHADALALRAWLLASAGRRDEARQLYGRALTAKPGMPEAQVGLAQLAEDDGRKDDARRLLEKAVRESPRHVPLRLAFARFLDRAGEKDRARAEVDAALRLAPADPAALDLRRALE